MSKKSPLLKLVRKPHGEEFEAIITRHQFEKLPQIGDDHGH